jgi:hypothetical protein
MVTSWNDQFVGLLEQALTAQGGSVPDRNGMVWNDYVLALLVALVAAIEAGGGDPGTANNDARVALALR